MGKLWIPEKDNPGTLLGTSERRGEGDEGGREEGKRKGKRRKKKKDEEKKGSRKRIELWQNLNDSRI